MLTNVHQLCEAESCVLGAVGTGVMSSSAYDGVVCLRAVATKKTCEPVQAYQVQGSQIFAVFFKTFSCVYQNEGTWFYILEG